MAEYLNWTPLNFLALPPDLSSYDTSRAIVVPVPHDSTESFRSGSRDGPLSIIQASSALEDYDMDLDFDVSQVGIHTTSFVEPTLGSPKLMVDHLENTVTPFYEKGMMLSMLGGEHSISISGAKAAKNIWDDVSVLYLDAHADLRNEYMGTRWGHASVARRISEFCPITLVGIRSMSIEEKKFIEKSRIDVFSPTELLSTITLEKIVESLSPNVYLSVDLDVFDPSIMSAVANPEPGGIDWDRIIALLKVLSARRRIVGFDVTELSPDLGPKSCSYIAAKLVLKVIAYALYNKLN